MDSCRFYEAALPVVNEVVFYRVTRADDETVQVTLPEYNCNASIMHAEVSQRRVRSLAKHMEGCREGFAIVTDVSNNGYIDLSRRRVTPQEMDDARARYTQGKLLHQICSQFGRTRQQPTETIMQQLVWPLQSQAFQVMHQLSDSGQFANPLLQALCQEEQSLLLKLVRHYMPVHEFSILAVFTVQGVVTPRGIEDIRDALLAGKNADPQVSIRLIASPHYSATVSAKVVDEGIQRINKVLDAIKSELGAKGHFHVHKQPHAVNNLAEALKQEQAKEGLDEEDDDEL